MAVTHLAPKTFSIGMLGTWHLAPKHIWHLHIRPLRMFGIWDIWPPGMFGTWEVWPLGMFGTRDIRHLGMFGTLDVWPPGMFGTWDVWPPGMFGTKDVWHPRHLAPYCNLVIMFHHSSKLLKSWYNYNALEPFLTFVSSMLFIFTCIPYSLKIKAVLLYF